MKKWLSFFYIATLFIIFTCPSFAIPQNSIVGKWQTIDDVTQKPRSIIQIYQASDNSYQGKIIKVYYRPGEGVNDVCDKCTDLTHKNKKILGMVILWGLQQTGPGKWSNGLILDPDNGKIYRALAYMDSTGNTLNARGYIGFSIFGRTQIWNRVDNKGNLIS